LLPSEGNRLRDVARFILDSLPFYAMIVDEDHRIVIANKKVVEDFGIQVEEIEGAFCPKRIHGLDRPYPGCPLEKSVENGGVYAESEFFDEASKKWYLSIVYPLGISSRKEKRLFLHFTIDITDRKMAEKLEVEKKIGEDKYRAIFENTINPVAIIDKNGRMLEANPSMTDILGFDPAGKRLDEIFSETSGKVKEFLNTALESNETITFRQNVGDRSLIFSIIPAKIGGKGHLILIGRDMTEILRREQLLKMILSVERELDKFEDLRDLLVKVSESIVSVRGYHGVRIDLVGKDRLTVTAGELKEYLVEECPVISETIERGNDVVSDTGKCPENCAVKGQMPERTMLHIAVMPVRTDECNGSIAFFSSKPFDQEELAILKTMASDMSRAIKNYELNRMKKEAYTKVEESIEKIALLIDRIRNPLTVISAYAELYPESEISDVIMKQVEKINGIIRNLDDEWRRSEEFRRWFEALLR